MPVKAEADKRASFARDVESRLDYSIVHRSPVRTCECKILVRGRVTVNMRRARRGVGLDSSEVTRSCRMPPCRGRAGGERGRAETASPSRAPAARGLRDPHPASAPRWPRDRCGNLRASTTTAHEQRREHAVHVTGNTKPGKSRARHFTRVPARISTFTRPSHVVCG